MVDMATLNILRTELANVRRSRDRLAEAIGPMLVPEAASAIGKLTRPLMTFRRSSVLTAARRFGGLGTGRTSDVGRQPVSWERLGWRGSASLLWRVARQRQEGEQGDEERETGRQFESKLEIELTETGRIRRTLTNNLTNAEAPWR